LHERKIFTITVYRIRQSEDFAKYIFHIYIFKRRIYCIVTFNYKTYEIIEKYEHSRSVSNDEKLYKSIRRRSGWNQIE
jgi:hypothetical protein